MIQMYNIKFDASAENFLSDADNRHSDTLTHIHVDQTQKMVFSDSGNWKRVNPSKSPLRKFDPKTIPSLLISKKK